MTSPTRNNTYFSGYTPDVSYSGRRGYGDVEYNAIGSLVNRRGQMCDTPTPTPTPEKVTLNPLVDEYTALNNAIRRLDLGSLTNLSVEAGFTDWTKLSRTKKTSKGPAKLSNDDLSKITDTINAKNPGVGYSYDDIKALFTPTHRFHDDA